MRAAFEGLPLRDRLDGIAGFLLRVLLLLTMPSVLDPFFFPILAGFAVVCARELIRLSID